MRKLLMALGCMFFMAGLVIAAEVTLVKFDKDKKEVTVKDDKDKETTYKITDKTKFIAIDKDGKETEGKYENFEKRMSNEKAAGKAKFDITGKDGVATEIKTKAGGKGKN